MEAFTKVTDQLGNQTVLLETISDLEQDLKEIQEVFQSNQVMLQQTKVELSILRRKTIKQQVLAVATGAVGFYLVPHIGPLLRTTISTLKEVRLVGIQALKHGWKAVVSQLKSLEGRIRGLGSVFGAFGGDMSANIDPTYF